VKFKGIYAAVTALSLVAAPTLAAAAPIATPLTQPATESVEGDNAFTGVTGGSVVIGILAIIAVGAGIYVAVDNDDDDLPTSP
jgi:hypothetical protein